MDIWFSLIIVYFVITAAVINFSLNGSPFSTFLGDSRMARIAEAIFWPIVLIILLGILTYALILLFLLAVSLCAIYLYRFARDLLKI